METAIILPEGAEEKVRRVQRIGNFLYRLATFNPIEAPAYMSDHYHHEQ